MKKKNNKGFTLIELLAVIVVLAIIILFASSNIFGMVEKFRANALAQEGNTLIQDAARPAYQMAVMEKTITSGSACFSLEYLSKEAGYSKNSSNNYTGSVLISLDASGKVPTYTVWISNGSSVISNKQLGTTGSDAEAGTTASNDCGGATNITLFGIDASGKVSITKK